MEKCTTDADLHKKGFERFYRFWDNEKEAAIDCYIYSLCISREKPEFTLQFLHKKLESVTNLNLQSIYQIVELLENRNKEESEELETLISTKLDEDCYRNEIILFKDSFDSIEKISEELNTRIKILNAGSENQKISKERHFNPILTNIYSRNKTFDILLKDQPLLQKPRRPLILGSLVKSIDDLINCDQALKLIKPPYIKKIHKVLLKLTKRYKLPLNTKKIDHKFLHSTVILSPSEKFEPVAIEHDSAAEKIPSNASDNPGELPFIRNASKISEFFTRLDLN